MPPAAPALSHDQKTSSLFISAPACAPSGHVPEARRASSPGDTQPQQLRGSVDGLTADVPRHANRALRTKGAKLRGRLNFCRSFISSKALEAEPGKIAFGIGGQQIKPVDVQHPYMADHPRAQTPAQRTPPVARSNRQRAQQGRAPVRFQRHHANKSGFLPGDQTLIGVTFKCFGGKAAFGQQCLHGREIPAGCKTVFQFNHGQMAGRGRTI